MGKLVVLVGTGKIPLILYLYYMGLSTYIMDLISNLVKDDKEEICNRLLRYRVQVNAKAKEEKAC